MQVQQIRRKPASAAFVSAAAIDPSLDDEPFVDRWPRRSRFLFIVGAASLCWAVPAAIVYLVLLPH